MGYFSKFDFNISAFVLAASLAGSGAAFAQAPPAAASAPPANVSAQAISDYVQSHSATTRLDRIARWEDPICLSITGLPAKFGSFITQRVRQVATAAGVPVDTGASCKPNVDIVFTAKPQDLLDNVRKTTPTALGFFESNSQADRLAKVTRPIQGWYITQTMDLRNMPQIDSRDNNVATTQSVTGRRAADGLRSAFHHVLVVADPGKLGLFEIGTLADDIAFLALAQPAAPDACQDLPSINDMLTEGCHPAAPVTAITAADTAYLKGLYKATLGVSLRLQESEIAGTMADALGAH